MRNLEQFYIEWIARLDRMLKGYVIDRNGKKYRTRYAYLTAQKYLSKLLAGTLEEPEKIIILPGIRGVGKTTLLSQLYFFEQFVDGGKNPFLDKNKAKLDNRIYVSADKLVFNNLSLGDFVDYLEKNIWGSLIDSDKKTLILIDEIQYDEKWNLFLKLLFDRTKGNNNILVVATGSSAILLKKRNKDLVRRSVTEKIFPTKFTEFIYLHKGLFPEKNLSANIKKALFYSGDARESFRRLNEQKAKIINYLGKNEELEMRKQEYFLRGSFPFSAQMNNETQSLERVKEMVLTNIVQRDLILSGDFDAETMVKMPDTLFLLANSCEISVGTLSETLKLNIATVQKILQALVDAEILFEVLPYGQPYSQVRKASKYLFITPNIRAGLLGGLINPDRKGSLLEDYCALLFSKEFSSGEKFYYDYSKGGADFVVRFENNDELVMEVGYNKKKISQVKKTMEKSSKRLKYGLVIGGDELELIGNNIVKVPVDYFLLI